MGDSGVEGWLWRGWTGSEGAGEVELGMELVMELERRMGWGWGSLRERVVVGNES